MAAPVSAQRTPQRQTSATGVITDSNSGTPVRGALVEFPALRRQSITDINGRFLVQNLKPGRHKMVVNQMGFETVVREVDVGEGEPLNVALAPDPIMLKGIDVQVDRIAARRKGVSASVMTYERDRLVSSSAFNTADFARTNLGMFTCGRGREFCVLRRGAAVQPVVYIDERRAFGLTELEVYPISDIFLIESYDGGA